MAKIIEFPEELAKLPKHIRDMSFEDLLDAAAEPDPEIMALVDELVDGVDIEEGNDEY